MPILRGDLNHDGVVDAADVPGFVDVLLEVNTNPLDVDEADINRDCAADGDDMQRFIAMLIP